MLKVCAMIVYPRESQVCPRISRPYGRKIQNKTMLRTRCPRKTHGDSDRSVASFSSSSVAPLQSRIRETQAERLLLFSSWSSRRIVLEPSYLNACHIHTQPKQLCRSCKTSRKNPKKSDPKKCVWLSTNRTSAHTQHAPKHSLSDSSSAPTLRSSSSACTVRDSAAAARASSCSAFSLPLSARLAASCAARRAAAARDSAASWSVLACRLRAAAASAYWRAGAVAGENRRKGMGRW